MYYYYPMANLRTIERGEGEVYVTLKMSHREYDILKESEDDLLVLPVNGYLVDELTTGKLGNGNRIMLPSKILKRHGMEELKKKISSRIFELTDGKYLLCKLDEDKPGVPAFMED